jgi:hypothetical protein
VIVPGGHFDAYVKSFDTFSGHARNGLPGTSLPDLQR